MWLVIYLLFNFAFTFVLHSLNLFIVQNFRNWVSINTILETFRFIMEINLSFLNYCNETNVIFTLVLKTKD